MKRVLVVSFLNAFYSIFKSWILALVEIRVILEIKNLSNEKYYDQSNINHKLISNYSKVFQYYNNMKHYMDKNIIYTRNEFA